ncbi:MAG TPA: hypothetical protein VE093_32860 [Polyangiaceae bacterium]|nr:hypothetical protein [Polyangiaceae bacterium]
MDRLLGLVPDVRRRAGAAARARSIGHKVLRRSGAEPRLCPTCEKLP